MHIAVQCMCSYLYTLPLSSCTATHSYLPRRWLHLRLPHKSHLTLIRRLGFIIFLLKCLHLSFIIRDKSEIHSGVNKAEPACLRTEACNRRGPREVSILIMNRQFGNLSTWREWKCRSHLFRSCWRSFAKIFEELHCCTYCPVAPIVSWIGNSWIDEPGCMHTSRFINVCAQEFRQEYPSQENLYVERGPQNSPNPILQTLNCWTAISCVHVFIWLILGLTAAPNPYIVHFVLK